MLDIHEQAESAYTKRKSSLRGLESTVSILTKFTNELEKHIRNRNAICNEIKEKQGCMYAARETIKMPKFSYSYEPIQGYTMKNVSDLSRGLSEL